MVKIPKKDVGEGVVKGTLVRLSPISKLWGKRFRVGVLVNVNGEDIWFNDYGTEEALTRKYDTIGIDEQLTISYDERNFKRSDGTPGVARDIKSLTSKHTRLSEKDAKAFMPESEINVEKLLKDLERISVIVNSWRGVLVGKEEG